MRFSRLQAAAVSCVALALSGGWSFGATFSNPTSITIGDNANASLYPSTITVPVNVAITNISVSLEDFAHNRMSDLTILLVSPSGRKIQLIANAPGSVPPVLTIGFSDSGRLLNGDPIGKVPYRCTLIPGPQAMPAPAPGLPYQSSFASLIGENAAGTWSLYIRDNVTGETGQVAQGWSLNINSSQLSPAHSEFSYQGVLKQNGVALNGLFDVKADLWKSPISTVPGDLAGSSTSFGVAVSNGVFTTRFAPPESSLISGQALWIEISVKGPGDASFVKLSPREPISSTPLATYATFAESADVAALAQSVSWFNITSVPPNVENAFSPWQDAGANSIFFNTPGSVFIGATAGSSKLTVNGRIESTSGGVKFPDGTVQTTAATTMQIIGSKTMTSTLGAIGAGAELTVLITFSGTSFETTDVAVLSPGSNLPADVGIEYVRVASAISVQFRLRNHGSVTATVPSMTYTVKVIR